MTDRASLRQIDGMWSEIRPCLVSWRRFEASDIWKCAGAKQATNQLVSRNTCRAPICSSDSVERPRAPCRFQWQAKRKCLGCARTRCCLRVPESLSAGDSPTSFERKSRNKERQTTPRLSQHGTDGNPEDCRLETGQLSRSIRAWWICIDPNRSTWFLA